MSSSNKNPLPWTALILPTSLAVTAYLAVRSVLAGHGLNLVGGPLTAQDHRLLAGGAVTGLMAYLSPIIVAKIIGAIKSATSGAATPATPATPAAPGVPAMPGGNMIGAILGEIALQGKIPSYIPAYIETALGLNGSGIALQAERVLQAVAAFGRPVSINCVFSWGPGRDFPVTYNVGPVAPSPTPAVPAPNPAAPLPGPLPAPSPVIQPLPGSVIQPIQ